MGLTNSSVGIKAADSGLKIQKRSESDKVIALAGNPNVGKSTIFNALTGMNQHTGNWPGKTVASAQGFCQTKNNSYVLVDIPGTYSLMAHSAEEEVARDFICFSSPDAVIVVCDATCLERNLNLVLQTMEISPNVLVCVNLMDEARRKHISIDLALLSKRLGAPVTATVARKKKSLARLMGELDKTVVSNMRELIKIEYCDAVERAIDLIQPVLESLPLGGADPRWLSLKLLENDSTLTESLRAFLKRDILSDSALRDAVSDARALLLDEGINGDILKDKIVSAVVKKAESVCKGVITYEKQGYDRLDRRIDRVLTSRLTGYPIMLLMLAAIFYLTIVGANYPSALLSSALFWVQDRLTELFTLLHAPDWLHGALVLGVYRVLAWVISVMLPPMAIFFPLFTLLEDAGYLPRIAYNLDKPFKRCRACGKQALCMAMGFGCNAAGVVGCRIIDSPRERLLAIITNSFVPCNGRFPTLISVITMFFIGAAGGAGAGILSALLLTLIILLGIGMTFFATRLLSATVLKGVPSSFTLELPPYRRPQVGQVIVRSIFDRTLFVLGRAAAVAAPAGLLIWLMANISIGDMSLLARAAAFIDPFARLMGLDGVILLAFILGFPANEIVVPIIIMAYTAQGSILDMSSLGELKSLFVSNGWTWVTAINMLIFSMFHWPCSTTLITIKKESGSMKWTVLAFLLPTFTGIILCMLFTASARLLA